MSDYNEFSWLPSNYPGHVPLAQSIPLQTLHRSMKSPAAILVTLSSFLIGACTGETEQRPPAEPSTVLITHTTQRAAFEIVGRDTLSDSARVTLVLPEQDGDGIVAIFTDPARGVSAGLAIIDQRTIVPQLLWPDSVSAAWWSGPHMIAFTTNTGQGIRLVVDVHAAELRVIDTSARSIAPPAEPARADTSVTQRARAYIDSIHLQIAGTSPDQALTYSVTRVVPSPDHTMAVFHSSAQDARGILTNPSWFLLNRTDGSITLIDRIIGPANELPNQAGEWSGNSSFFYAKGQAIWEAEIQRLTTER